LLYLKKCIFFEHLNHDSLLKLIAKARVKTVAQGEVVIKEGETGDVLYIVQ
jgi:CRP-like cAMP-binding protein